MLTAAPGLDRGRPATIRKPSIGEVDLADEPVASAQFKRPRVAAPADQTADGESFDCTVSVTHDDIQEQEVVVPDAQPELPEGAAASAYRNDFTVESPVHPGCTQPGPKRGFGGFGEHGDKRRGSEGKDEGTAIHVGSVA